MKRTLYYRSTSSGCDCTQIYNGELELLLLVNSSKSCPEKARINNKKYVFVTYDLLMGYTTAWSNRGVTLRAYYDELSDNFLNKWKKPFILTWTIWRFAVIRFWNEVLEIDMKKVFQCIECRLKPPVLVADGTSVGFQARKLLGETNLFVPLRSKEVISAPIYRKRMFVKKQVNRNILKEAFLQSD